MYIDREDCDMEPVDFEQAKHISSVLEKLMEADFKDLWDLGYDMAMLMRNIMSMNEENGDKKRNRKKKRKRNALVNGYGLKKRKLNVDDSDIDDEYSDIDNPLREYDDPIAPDDKLKRPEICNCITKHHVASHSTWMKILKVKQQCPYVREGILTRRDLIKLTYDNFKMYKHKIDNLDI